MFPINSTNDITRAIYESLEKEADKLFEKTGGAHRGIMGFDWSGVHITIKTEEGKKFQLDVREIA